MSEPAGEQLHQSKSPPLSADTLKWPSVAERPSETPSIHTQETAETTTPYKVEDYRERMKSQAEEVMRNNNALRDLITNVNILRWQSTWVVRDWTKKPDEVNALVILLDKALSPSTLYQERADMLKTINVALQVLRPNGWGTSWVESSNYPQPNAADSILTQVRSEFKQQKLTQAGFDAAVVAAFACGDLRCAFELIQKAGDFLPDQGQEAVGNALSRFVINHAGMKSQVDRFYDFYPPHLRSQLTATMAAIGEEGKPLEGLKTQSEAQFIKKKAEESLRQDIIERRQRWYNEQRVVKLALREDKLSEQALQARIDEAAKAGLTFEDVRTTIDKQAAEIVDGIVANSLAAELMRRLNPDFSINDQAEFAKREALGIRSNTTQRLNSRNEYEDIFQTSQWSSTDLSPVERETATSVDFFKIQRQIPESVSNSHRFDFGQLVYLLKNPDSFFYMVGENIKTRLRNPVRMPDDKYQTEEYFKRTLARKIVPALNFLQIVAENDRLRQVLEKQFGLAHLATPEKLERAVSESQKFFGEKLFDEVFEGEDQQINFDAEVAQRVSKAAIEETKSLQAQKRDEAGAIATDMYNQTKIQLEALTEQKQQKDPQLRHLQEEQSKTKQELEQVNQTLEALGYAQIVGRVRAALGQGMTQQEYDRQRLALTGRQASAESMLQNLTQQITLLGEVPSQQQIDDMRKIFDNYQKLRPYQQ